jgi:hypothetical protein
MAQIVPHCLRLDWQATAAGLLADPLQRRHQDRHQQGDDGDYNQQLDQCERS